MSGKVIEEISRVTGKEDETEATFIYVLTQKNIRKINETRFRVILDNHQEKDPEVHNVALIFLDQK